MKKTLLLIAFSLYGLGLFAQKINEKYQYHINKATSEIRIDGKLDETQWQRCESATDFWMMTPADTSRAKCTTVAKFTYDDKYLYFSAINSQQKEAPYIVESLKRDFNFGRNDNLWLVLEPFNDLTNGWVFGTNAAGAQFDGQIGEGTNLNQNWDNRWTSQTSFDGQNWILEMAIPFSSLRYKAGETHWGMNLSRLDLGSNEKSSWAPIPRQFFSITLAYTGTLVWDNPPPAPKTNISIIPYLLGGASTNFEKNENAVFRKDIGGDAKIALTPSLNLDLTVNPDFSQVDVDQQVTNLNRFELFFPERRQFFLENADLFNNFGLDGLRPFFSRRIGLGVPITYGARLSGKLNNNLRIGAMNIQTNSQHLTDSTIRPNQNFTALVLQQKVFKRSSVGLMFLNKESLNFSEKTNLGFTDFNRNIGVEYNLASANNEWTGKAMIMKSFSPRTSGADVMQAYNLKYTPTHWLIEFQHENVGVNYNPEIGYVPRRGYKRFLVSEISYLHFPKKASSNAFFQAPTVSFDYYWNTNGELTDAINLVGYISLFKSLSRLSTYFQTNYYKLQNDFDPTNGVSNEILKAGSEHRYNTFNLDYFSSPRKKYTANFSGSYGGYYGDGKLLNLSTTLGYRFQPYVNISASVNYVEISDVKVPVSGQAEKVVNSHFFLVSPKIDVTFSNKLFWTTFVQYNEQRQNTNINSRIQWRYKPASDIFLVYTDNYFPNSYEIKNRAVVLKMTYWLNL